MKKKKNQTVNNKFNFDDEYIIGVSNSDSKTRKTDKQKKQKPKKKKKDKQSKKIPKVKKTNIQKEKKIKSNKKKFKLNGTVLKIVIVIVLFVGAGCFLCLSPAFNVEQIIVENNNKLSADTVKSLSKIQLYKNMFLINKSEAAKNIEKNSYVESVKISRKIPNKIKIVVKEREPKYLVEFGEGKYAIIDGQGYVLEIVSERVEGLPILVGIQTSADHLIDIKDNSTRLWEDDLKKLDTVASIVETAKNYEVFDFITKIDIADPSNYKLTLESEQKVVYLGSYKDINTKIQYMKEILNNEKGKKGEIFLNRELSTSKPPFFRESVN